MPKGIHGSSSVCTVDGCERRMLAKGLCSMHWQRQKKHGDPGAAASQVRAYDPSDTCSVDGCTRRPRGRGLCGTHWVRQKKYGDPLITKQAPNGAGHVTPRGYRMLTMPGHPLATKNGFVFEHRVVLYRTIGGGTHPCHWCGRPVSWDLSWPADEAALVVDHLDDDKLNNDPSNLVPSCNPCNHARAFA